ncbi:MAG: ParA family protein [Gammaproteobacteria bacterium]|nr:ParA family protein [Gammaproteobacteria bacterium]
MTNVYVIAIANSKGGALKTTACQVLASEFIRQLVAPHLIDLDADKQVSGW